MRQKKPAQRKPGVASSGATVCHANGATAIHTQQPLYSSPQLPTHQRPASAQEGCPSGFSLIMHRLVSSVKLTVRSWPICAQEGGCIRGSGVRDAGGCTGHLQPGPSVGASATSRTYAIALGSAQPLPNAPTNRLAWKAERMYWVRMKGLSCLESICCWISENSTLALSISASLLPCDGGCRRQVCVRAGGKDGWAPQPLPWPIPRRIAAVSLCMLLPAPRRGLHTAAAPLRACRPGTCQPCTRPPGRAPPALGGWQAAPKGQFAVSTQLSVANRQAAEQPASDVGACVTSYTPNPPRLGPSARLGLGQREALLHRLLACRQRGPGAVHGPLGQHGVEAGGCTEAKDQKRTRLGSSRGACQSRATMLLQASLQPQ